MISAAAITRQTNYLFTRAWPMSSSLGDLQQLHLVSCGMTTGEPHPFQRPGFKALWDMSYNHTWFSSPGRNLASRSRWILW